MFYYYSFYYSLYFGMSMLEVAYYIIYPSWLVAPEFLVPRNVRVLFTLF